MTDTLSALAERVKEQPLIFREQRNGMGFYTAGKKLIIEKNDFLNVELEGAFTNLYPNEEWYKREAVLMRSEDKKKALFQMDKADVLPLFVAYRFSCCASDEQFSLTENGKKMLVSSAFLEADVKRAVDRNDKSVIIRRALKTASYYYDYYYEGNVEKTEKGYLSAAFSCFMKNILEILSYSSLQETDFII